MRIYLALLWLLLLPSTLSFGQVGINNPNPDTTALLDLTSNKLGLLVPRMTSFERRAITNPANALLVYDKDDGMFYFQDTTNGTFIRHNWTGLSPFRFRDDSTRYDTISATYKRDIYTHPTVRYFGLGTTAPLSSLSLIGNLSVGTNAEAAPANGIVVDGDIKAKANITVTETVTAKKFEGFGTIPLGGIIMWSGNPAAVPSGWTLCDGTINGTPNTSIPDLSGKFVVGYMPVSAATPNITANATAALKEENYGGVGNTGGELAHTLTKAELPKHQHEANGNGATINITSSGSHDHDYEDFYMNEASNSGDYADGDGTGRGNSAKVTDPESHTHPNSSFNGLTGLGKDVLENSHENRPPYFVIAYIIRIE